MNQTVARIVAFVAGLVVGVGAMVVIPFLGDRLDIGLGGEEPLADITIIDKNNPLGLDPGVAVDRLDRNTNRRWGMVIYSDDQWADEPFLDNYESLAKAVVLPSKRSLDTYAVKGTWTNAEDADSVRANGALKVIWFQSTFKPQDWLLTKPRAFVDNDLDKGHKTWWSGEIVVDYTPPASGQDLTEQIHQWIREVWWCPTTAGVCDVPDEVVETE